MPNSFFKKLFLIKNFYDVFQILTIIVLFALNLFFVYLIIDGFFPNLFPQRKCSGCGYIECRTGYKKSLSYLNQSVSLNKALDNKVPYENENDFALMLTKRMSIVDARNIKGNEKFPCKDLTKQEIKKYKIPQYQGKPMIQTADGMNFIITKFQNGCKIVDPENLENNDCIIDVDVSGFQMNRNELTTDCRKPRDIIRYYVDGSRDIILAPEIYKPCVFNEYKVKE